MESKGIQRPQRAVVLFFAKADKAEVVHGLCCLVNGQVACVTAEAFEVCPERGAQETDGFSVAISSGGENELVIIKQMDMRVFGSFLHLCPEFREFLAVVFMVPRNVEYWQMLRKRSLCPPDAFDVYVGIARQYYQVTVKCFEAWFEWFKLVVQVAEDECFQAIPFAFITLWFN